MAAGAAGLRLNLGAGGQPLPDWTNLDRKNGEEIFPLPYEDGAASEIRASHVLEHFSHLEIGAVLADWVRVLQPGGLLRVAVPDFETVARSYLAGDNIPVQGYVMGGHTDSDDRHGAIFDAEALLDGLHGAGLVGLHRWKSEQEDCAALPISLNLAGTKPPERWPTVRAVMSMPRLGWNDMWGCAMETLGSLGIRLTKVTGAFWEQCLERAMSDAMESGAEYILAFDYDTIFDKRDIETLICAATRYPEADAIAALQTHRRKATPLMTMRGTDGLNVQTVPFDLFDRELVPAVTAHFGCTLIRAEKLKQLVRPWFHGQPDSEGMWGDGRTDPDISFWRTWEAAGNSLFIASRVPVGHLEVMVRWPGRDMAAIYQHPNDYHEHGRPEKIWR